jgi:Domain of unknown function (DUF3331)
MFGEQISFGPFNVFGSPCRATEATRDAAAWARGAGLSSRDGQRPWKNVVVAVIDRPSPLTALVAWQDSTSCRYGDQLWRAGIAKSGGVCVLSGVAIEPGDAIYRPVPKGVRPCNAEAMMSTSAVRAAVCPD